MKVKHPSGAHHERVRKHLDSLPAIHHALRESYKGPTPAQVERVQQQLAADVQTVSTDTP